MLTTHNSLSNGFLIGLSFKVEFAFELSKDPPNIQNIFFYNLILFAPNVCLVIYDVLEVHFANQKKQETLFTSSQTAKSGFV